MPPPRPALPPSPAPFWALLPAAQAFDLLWRRLVPLLAPAVSARLQARAARRAPPPGPLLQGEPQRPLSGALQRPLSGASQANDAAPQAGALPAAAGMGVDPAAAALGGSFGAPVVASRQPATGALHDGADMMPGGACPAPWGAVHGGGSGGSGGGKGSGDGGVARGVGSSRGVGSNRGVGSCNEAQLDGTAATQTAGSMVTRVAAASRQPGTACADTRIEQAAAAALPAGSSTPTDASPPVLDSGEACGLLCGQPSREQSAFRSESNYVLTPGVSTHLPGGGGGGGGGASKVGGGIEVESWRRCAYQPEYLTCGEEEHTMEGVAPPRRPSPSPPMPMPPPMLDVRAHVERGRRGAPPTQALPPMRHRALAGLHAAAGAARGPPWQSANVASAAARRHGGAHAGGVAHSAPSGLGPGVLTPSGYHAATSNGVETAPGPAHCAGHGRAAALLTRSRSQELL
eukprot:259727-Chlamydomonas_euryale.AAC.1